MKYYLLPNYYDSWILVFETLSKVSISKIDDYKKLFNDLGVDSELNTIDNLIETKKFNEYDLCQIINEIIKCALELPNYFQTGKIERLSQGGQTLHFTRAQVLCLLSNMFLCNMKKSKENLYWVNFDIWLGDGRPCAVCYLQTLLEYFRQSFFDLTCLSESFRQEIIEFKRVDVDINKVIAKLESSNLHANVGNVELLLTGSIGDDPQSAEIDFANQDIGYGKTGTQEEILFGASPELCISMLFCDTMRDNEAIIISKVRRVANFNGYGFALSFNSLIPIDSCDWNKREIIAIDALDFSSDYETSYKLQFQLKNLKRELVKAFVGFSNVDSNAISTGFWGCGAFCGDKELKSLIQILAACLSQKNIKFYCFNRQDFYEKFQKLIQYFNEKNISVADIWSKLCNFDACLSNSVFDAFK